jgi:hypothetical protein
MPHVYTLEGSTSKQTPKCKRVKNKRTGCTIQLCFTGKGRTGWQFKKGSTVCPGRK